MVCMRRRPTDYNGAMIVQQINRFGIDEIRHLRVLCRKCNSAFELKLERDPSIHPPMQCPACRETFWYREEEANSALVQVFNALQQAIHLATRDAKVGFELELRN